MKRILPYILSCILLVYLIIVLTFVATKSGEVTCRGVRVAVKNTDVCRRGGCYEGDKEGVRRHYGQKYIGGE